MEDDFLKKISNLIESGAEYKNFGIGRVDKYRTIAGVSNVTSWLGLVEGVDDVNSFEPPDYILSDTLDVDLSIPINFCTSALKRSKYLPVDTSIEVEIGALPGGQRKRPRLLGWKDFHVLSFENQLLFTVEAFADADEHEALAMALWMIVKDICDDGRMLSEDWYYARILLEYFREHPLPPENAYLIGQLYKELCVKLAYEVDLASYYSKLAERQGQRERGADANKRKAEELRSYCVSLFVKMIRENGHQLLMAPDRMKANELRLRALRERHFDFERSGKPYSVEWFLKNIIEDRRVDIVQELERLSA